MKFIKANKLLIIVFILLLGYTVYETNISINEMDKIYIKGIQGIQKCEEDPNYLYSGFCDEITATKSDFFTIFSDVYSYRLLKVTIFIIILIIISGIYTFNKVLRTNTIKNILNRESYQQCLKKLFSNSYLSTLILPIIFIIVFIIIYSYVGNFNITTGFNSSFWNEQTMSHPIIFMIAYIVNLFINSALYVNISLCIVRKNYNIFITTILSLLTILGIEIFFEIFINGIICGLILKTSRYTSVFLIMNMLALADDFGILTSIIVPFICLIISSIILYYMYRNKEKLLIDCEKNE